MYTQVTDAGLAHLTGLKELRSLILPSRIDGSGLVHLKGLSELRRLCLEGVKLTDKELRHLEALKKLQWVNLRRTDVTREGVARLRKKLPKVEVLSSLPGEQRRDALPEVSPLPCLRRGQPGQGRLVAHAGQLGRALPQPHPSEVGPRSPGVLLHLPLERPEVRLQPALGLLPRRGAAGAAEATGARGPDGGPGRVGAIRPQQVGHRSRPGAEAPSKSRAAEKCIP